MENLTVEAPQDVEPEGTLSVFTEDTGPSPLRLGDDVINQRAQKYYQALSTFPDEQLSVEDVRDMIFRGNEQDLRKMAAMHEANEVRRNKLQEAKRYVSERDRMAAPSPEELDYMIGLSMDYEGDAETVLERRYADTFIDKYLTANGDSPILKAALEENSERAFELVDAASMAIARKEIAQRRYEELEADWENTSWLKSVGPIVKQFVPFYQTINLYDAVKDQEIATGVLPGANLRDQLDYLHSLPPREFKKAFDAAVDDIAEGSILDAQEFVRTFLAYSSTDESISNLIFGLDIADVSTLGIAGLTSKGLRKALTKGGKGVAKEAKSALQDVSRKGKGDRLDTPQVADTAKATPEGPDKPIPTVASEQNRPSIRMTPEKLNERFPNGSTAQKAEYVRGLVRQTNARGGEATVYTKDGSFKVIAIEDGDFVGEDGLLWNIQQLLDDPNIRFELNLPDSPKPKPAVEPGTAQADLAEHLKEAVKTAGNRQVDVVEAVASTGNVRMAAELEAHRRIVTRLHREADPRGDLNEFEKVLPSLFNPRALMSGAARLVRESADRIERNLFQNAANMLSALHDPARAMRFSDEAIRLIQESQTTKAKAEYSEVRDSILDVQVLDPSGNLGNAYQVAVDFGRPDATLFDSVGEAKAFAEHVLKVKEADTQVRRQGEKFYLRLVKDLDETTDDVRKAMITTGNTTPPSLVNTFLGWLRTPEDLLSKLSRANRHTATHATQEIHRLVLSATEGLQKLSKQERKDLERILTANRDYEDLDERGNVIRGRFYQSVEDLYSEYQELIGRSPTDAEVEAYFTYVQLSDLDYMVRNLSLYRDKARLGIKSITLKAKGNNPGTPGKVSFDGKIREGIPWSSYEGGSSQDAGILFVKSDGSFEYLRKHELAEETKKEIEGLINNENFKVIEIANPDQLPLERFSGIDDMVNFVVTKDFDADRLTFKQLPYKPGGHVTYASEFFTKQAKIQRTSSGRALLRGDKSIFTHATEAEAKKYSRAMEHARQLLKAGKEAELMAFADKNLPFDGKRFKSFFETGPKDEPPVLDINEPIDYVRSGQGLNDKFRNTSLDFRHRYERFDDSMDTVHNLYRLLNKKYAGEREPDLPAIKEEVGETGDVVMSLTAPSLVDPYANVANATANIMRMRGLEDAQIQMVESFIEEFADVMKPSIEELRANPMLHLQSPQWDYQADFAKRKAAENTAAAIVRFLGSGSSLQKHVDWVMNKVYDSIYKVAGQKYSDYVATKRLAYVRDPAWYFRNVAFHAKIGLFNPVQIGLQAQTFAVMGAATGNPLRAAAGTMGGTLMQMLKFTNNPDVIKDAARKAVRFGWKEEEFLEAYEGLRRSGLLNVGGEVANLDDIAEPKVFQSAVGKFLDKGTVFFKGVERSLRIGAWNIAYLEWKKANPGKKLTDLELGKVLVRQNDLTVNMTRASNSAWQDGLLSVPTQFLSYQTRLMELVLPSLFGQGRLKATEAWRVLAANSMLYGIPVGALGTAAGVWPWQEDLRQAAMEKGISPNEGLMGYLFNGVPSMLIQHASGTTPNYGERYGPSGISLFKDLLTGDKTFAETLLGASGNVSKDIARTLGDGFQELVRVFREDDPSYAPLASDFLDITKNITTVNQVVRTLWALNTGIWITKNDVPLTDVTTMEALYYGITGLHPQELSDTYLKIESGKELKDAHRIVKQEAFKNLRRGFSATDQKDREAYFRKANTILIMGGLNVPQRVQAMQEFLSSPLHMEDVVNYKFLMQSPDPENFQNRLNSTTSK